MPLFTVDYLSLLFCLIPPTTVAYCIYSFLNSLNCPFVPSSGTLAHLFRERAKSFLDACVPTHEELAAAADTASYELLKRKIIRELTYLAVLLCAFIMVILSSKTHDFYDWAIHFLNISTITAGFGLLCATSSLWIYVWSGTTLNHIVSNPTYAYILFNLLDPAPLFAFAMAATVYTAHILYLYFARPVFPLLAWIFGPPIFLLAARGAVDLCERVLYHWGRLERAVLELLEADTQRDNAHSRLGRRGSMDLMV